MASLDLEKAFDKVIHEAVFEGLERSGIDAASIAAIKGLYAGQHAYIIKFHIFSTARKPASL